MVLKDFSYIKKKKLLKWLFYVFFKVALFFFSFFSNIFISDTCLCIFSGATFWFVSSSIMFTYHRLSVDIHLSS